MRIAFLGDTHYCIPREWSGLRPGLDRLPDHPRYTPMTDAVLRPLLARIRQAAPDLLISSGDFVEGGLSANPPAARREMTEGLAFFTDLGIPFLIARGTHDALDLFRELAVPAIGRSVGTNLGESYFRHDAGDCAFLVLDYQRYAVGNAQDAWLESQLAAASQDGRRIFVVAHAPVYLWGRHFFGDPALIRRLDELLSAYPVEAYLCGHTHNQIVSFHARQEGRGWLQLTASSVGYPAMAAQPLEQYHPLADFGPENTYLWGIVEDSAPGFFLLDLTANGLDIHWESVAGEQQSFAVDGVRTRPTAPASPVAARATAEDFLQIKSAVLGVFNYTAGISSGQVSLNGFALGAIPANVAYAARRYLTIPGDALPTLDFHNTLTVRTPDLPAFAVGSFAIELHLLDGRTLRSRVTPEILVSGDRWQTFPGNRQLEPCLPNREIDLSLSF